MAPQAVVLFIYFYHWIIVLLIYITAHTLCPHLTPLEISGTILSLEQYHTVKVVTANFLIYISKLHFHFPKTESRIENGI